MHHHLPGYVRLRNYQYHMNQHGSDIALEKLNNIVNLGVNFDNKLSFRDHITDKTNKAYGVKQLSYEDRLLKKA